MFNIVGDWDLMADGKALSYWQFTADGKFVESSGKTDSSTNTGTWELKDDFVIIKYTNENVGYAVLSFEDENKAVGENRHKNGNTYDLVFHRVDPNFGELAHKRRTELINHLLKLR